MLEVPTCIAPLRTPTIRFLADLLERESGAGRLAVDNPMMAANVFMSMVVSGPVRFILSGVPLPEAQLHKRVHYGVRFFLDGALPR